MTRSSLISPGFNSWAYHKWETGFSSLCFLNATCTATQRQQQRQQQQQQQPQQRSQQQRRQLQQQTQPQQRSQQQLVQGQQERRRRKQPRSTDQPSTAAASVPGQPPKKKRRPPVKIKPTPEEAASMGNMGFDGLDCLTEGRGEKRGWPVIRTHSFEPRVLESVLPACLAAGDPSKYYRSSKTSAQHKKKTL
jgi:hypothetical protein